MTSENPTPIGPLLDSRGVILDLEEGDLVTDVVLVAEVVKEDGSTYVVVSSGEGTNWVKEVGLLTMGQSFKLNEFQ